jgi:hypothetical protein
VVLFFSFLLEALLVKLQNAVRLEGEILKTKMKKLIPTAEKNHLLLKKVNFTQLM